MGSVKREESKRESKMVKDKKLSMKLDEARWEVMNTAKKGCVRVVGGWMEKKESWTSEERKEVALGGAC